MGMTAHSPASTEGPLPTGAAPPASRWSARLVGRVIPVGSRTGDRSWPNFRCRRVRSLRTPRRARRAVRPLAGIPSLSKRKRHLMSRRRTALTAPDPAGPFRSFPADAGNLESSRATKPACFGSRKTVTSSISYVLPSRSDGLHAGPSHEQGDGHPRENRLRYSTRTKCAESLTAHRTFCPKAISPRIPNQE